MTLNTSRLHRWSFASLAAAVLLGLCTPCMAGKLTLMTEKTYDGYNVLYYQDGKLLGWVSYAGNHRWLGSHWLDDPNPEGDGTGGGGLNPDAIDGALDMVKKFGSPYHIEAEPWKNLMGRTNAPNDMGPNVIDPPPGSLFEEDGDAAGGGGSFDPTVPIGEQLPSQPGNSDDDDDDTSRRPDPADAADFDPHVIDPSPEPEVDLFSASMADAGAADGSSEPSQTGFVLLSPSVQGIGPGGANQSSNRMDPQPIPWATFGGHPGTYQRPTTVAGHGLR